jgi:hypothetical protein
LFIKAHDSNYCLQIEDEPSSKKRRSTRHSAAGETLVSLPMSSNSSSSKTQELSPSKRPQERMTFTAELMVFDLNRKCLLTEGEYELMLNAQQPSELELNCTQTQWETVPKLEVQPFSSFHLKIFLHKIF